MTAIEIENLSKQYTLGTIGSGVFWRDMNVWWANLRGKQNPYLKIGQINDRTQKADGDYVWALRDINIKIEEGDVVGIIGGNGAGKSTLLKILSRITTPTTGRITTYGRIASLLEVGTGFHQEMTGRENIYMNGSIMGMTRAEITRKLDEIVDFAGVAKYVDTPVKRYSSGMTVRLGFAIAAFLEPDILVVDEVLAVGDAEFTKKAIGKMKDVSQGEGRTVLFVSHNMSAVRNLCKRGIVLRNGILEYEGDVNSAIDYYTGTNLTELKGYLDVTDKDRKLGPLREFEYLSVRMLNDIGNVSNQEPLIFEMTFKRNVPSIKKCQLGISSRNSNDTFEWSCYSPAISLPEGKHAFTVRMSVPNHNTPMGRHRLNFSISMNDYNANVRDYDIIYEVITFNVNYIDAAHIQPFSVWPRREGTSIHNSTIEII